MKNPYSSSDTQAVSIPVRSITLRSLLRGFTLNSIAFLGLSLLYYFFLWPESETTDAGFRFSAEFYVPPGVMLVISLSLVFVVLAVVVPNSIALLLWLLPVVRRNTFEQRFIWGLYFLGIFCLTLDLGIIYRLLEGALAK